MSWLWILLIVVGALVGVILLLALLGASVKRGGVGVKLLKGISRFIWKFKFTRRMAVKASGKMIEQGRLPDQLVGGMDPKQARQAQEMLSSLSEEGREKLMETALEMDRDDISPERKQELMREASGTMIEDLHLGRSQRRAAERAQARQIGKTNRPSAQKPAQKSQKKKKKR
jgi:hypothetical protein